MLYDRILKERKQIQNKLDELQTKLQQLPDGKLICCHSGQYYKWYLSDGHRKTFIPKANQALARQLAAKKYLSYLYDDLSAEAKAIDFYLKHHRFPSNKAYRLLTELPGYRDLLSPCFQPLSQELTDWQNSAYDCNDRFPEQLIHKTASGKLVRSKSEAMIDFFLYTNQIPFRYECALVLDSVTLYPDFTIRHPKTGEVYYWEHFGLMNDPSYSKNAFSKLLLYSSHDIIPSIHLITTYETQDHPLTTEIIQKVIEHYFL